MPRAPALLLGAAGVLLTAGLTAFVALGGSIGAWAAMGAGASVAAVGFGLNTRWAREHLPGLKTLAMELAEQRDACLALRVELKRQRTARAALYRQPEPPDDDTPDPSSHGRPGARGSPRGMPGCGRCSSGGCRTSGASTVARMR